MEAIDATEFETRCRTLLGRVAATGEPVMVLKGGQPVAELRPVPRLRAKYPQDELEGTVVELGNIVEPALSARNSPHTRSGGTMFEEHERVVLTGDIPESKLKTGDVGTIVHVYSPGDAFEVEFLALDGRSAALATVLPSQVRPVAPTDLTHARQFASGEHAAAPRSSAKGHPASHQAAR